jgi:multicomponent Na+:H+ antiporter subunit D
VAFAANLFTLYLFYEMLSLATFPLVTHHQDREARGGGRTYLTYLLGTSVGLALPAIIYIYAKTGGAVDFLSPEVLGAHIDPMAGGILLLMLVFGFAKSGLMPFHSWLPGAMVAPTPVSALLHAVAVVKVGVFCVIRVYTGVFDQDLLQSVDTGIILTYVAAFTVLISSLIALSQDNLKRRLAFSTIGQLGYITVGVSMLSSGALSGVENPQAMTGSILHIAMHACGKITLFFCAGAIFVASGRKYISQLDGIGRRMPFTMTAFLIGVLSVIGLPPTGGVISKWYLIMGALEAKYVFVMVILLISSFLNIVYLLPIAVRAFFIPKNEGAFHGSVKEAPWQCVVPLCVTAVLSVLLFFFSGPLVELATRATDYLKPR